MELRHLRYFRAVAESKGFREAARRGSATSFFLPRIIREYRRRFPSVRLRLREMAPARQIDEFRAGRLDVGFTRPIPATDDARLRSECLYRDSLLAVLSKGHPASTRPVVPVKQLAAEPFVLFHRAGAPDLFDAIVRLCRRAGFTPRVVHEADMMQTVLTLVEAGEGVTLVPACVSNLRGSGVVLRPVEPDTVRIPLMMVWPEDRESRALRSFLDLVREQAETIRGMLPGRRRR